MIFKEIMGLKGNLLENFKKKVKVNKYAEIERKILYTENVVNNFVKGEETLANYKTIYTISKKVSKEEIDNVKDIIKLKGIRECNMLAIKLNCYCGDIFETNNLDYEEYEAIMKSGIYDYILTQCKNDYEMLEKLVAREILNIQNAEVLETVHLVLSEQLQNIDIKEMEKLKQEISDIEKLENYKEIKEIANKINR